MSMSNSAPEKIYLTSDEKNSYVFTQKRSDNKGVEYIRTDAFIEKAKKWFEIQNEGVDSDGNYKCDMTDFEDFRNYIKG